MSKERKRSKTKPLVRSTRLLAIVTIALPLLLLGWIALIEIGHYELERQVREEVTFTLLLDQETSNDKTQVLLQKVQAAQFVKSASFISADQAAKELAEELGDNPTKVLGYNPLQPSIEVKLKADYTSADSLSVIDPLIKQWGGVEELSYRSDMLDQVDQYMGKISFILLLVSIALLIIAILQVNSTTHIMIYSKRFIIRSMTLLGAKVGTIRRPFIGYSVLNGLWGGLLADLLLYISLWLIKVYGNFDMISFITFERFIAVLVLIPLIGMIVSAFTAMIATSKYIRMDRGKIVLS